VERTDQITSLPDAVAASLPAAESSAPLSVSIIVPQRRYRVLRRLVPKGLQPLVRGLRKRIQMAVQRGDAHRLEEPYATVFPYTQAHRDRQFNIVRLAGLIDSERIPGDLVECGVLDGGTAALMAYATVRSEPERRVHMFDSWQGLPNPTADDGESAQEWSGEDVGSASRVLAVMRKLHIERRRLFCYAGWFDDTFKTATIDAIALLHIDADFYNSVRLCLERWYPVLSPGAFVQIDDYDSFSGCQKAVNEFLREHPEVKLESHGVDARAWYFRKPLLSGSS